MRKNYNSHLSELDTTKEGKLAHKLSKFTGQNWYSAIREIRILVTIHGWEAVKKYYDNEVFNKTL
jgi:hypothetical protein